MTAASSGAKSPAAHGEQVVGDVLLEPVLARAAGRQGVARAVPQRAIARVSEVRYSLNWLPSGVERDELHVVAGGLAGARADQAVGARQLDRQEVADREVDRRAAPVLPTGLTIDVVVVGAAADDAVVEVDVVGAVRVLRGEA